MGKNKSYKRGEIYYVKCNNAVGSEQTKERPCLILQTNTANIFGSTITIAPISKTRRKLPTHVWIDRTESNGLKYDSSIKCDQVTTVDSIRLTNQIGVIEDELLPKIDRALYKHLAMKKKHLF